MKKIPVSFFLIFLSIWILINCSRNYESGEIIVKPLGFKQINQFGDIIESVQYIPLEITDKSMIISILKTINLSDGRFIVKDHLQVLLFNENGSYIRTYGNQGKGPGEYTSIIDICVDLEEKYLYLLDSYNQINIYTIDEGYYLRNIKIPVKDRNFDAIAPSNDDKIFLFSSNPLSGEDIGKKFYCLSEFNHDGRLVSQFLPRKDFAFNIERFSRSFEGNYFIRPLEGDNLLYKIVRGKVNHYMRIDFGESAVPQKFIYSFGDDPWENISSYILSPYFKLMMGFADNKDKMYFYCAGELGNSYEFLFCKETLKGVYWVDSSSTPFRFQSADSVYFYGFYYPYVNELNENSITPISPVYEFLKIEKELMKKGHDNPILVKVKFKDLCIQE